LDQSFFLPVRGAAIRCEPITTPNPRHLTDLPVQNIDLRLASRAPAVCRRHQKRSPRRPAASSFGSVNSELARLWLARLQQ
jgi:hypothetical protein